MKDKANKTLKKGKALRFAYDKEYRERIMRKYKKKCEKKYHKEIRTLQRELDKLINERDSALKKERKRRWVDIGFVSINETEGLIKIEDKVYYFSEVDYAKRVEDFEDHSRMNSYNTYSTKRHPSVLGAGVGGVVGAKAGGLFGGIAGAAIGSKVFSKKEMVVTPHPYMEYSYKYNYLSVKYSVKGVVDEHVYFSTPRWKTNEVTKQVNEALKIEKAVNRIAGKLGPKGPVKTSVEDPVILDYDARIKDAKRRLDERVKRGVDYKLPEEYLRYEGE